MTAAQWDKLARAALVALGVLTIGMVIGRLLAPTPASNYANCTAQFTERCLDPLGGRQPEECLATAQQVCNLLHPVPVPYAADYR